jgi:DNA-binding transcriptional ArsR family regulator
MGDLLKENGMQDSYDRFLTTLKNRPRLAIVKSLIGGEKNVGQLTSDLGVHQTTVSHSLKRLLDCGFVFVERNGKERVYSVNKKTILPLMRLMDNHVSNYCAKGVCKEVKDG